MQSTEYVRIYYSDGNKTYKDTYWDSTVTIVDNRTEITQINPTNKLNWNEINSSDPASRRNEDSPITSPNVLGLIQAPFLSKYNYYTGDDARLHLSTVYSGKNYDDDNYPFDFASNYAVNTALANPYWILDNGDASNKNNQEVTQFNLNVMPKWQINRPLFQLLSCIIHEPGVGYRR